MVAQQSGHYRKPGGRVQRAPRERLNWAELSCEPAAQCEGVPAPCCEEDAALLSRGSKNHASGRCRPCRVFFSADGCREGARCNFCHHRHTEAKLQEMEVFSAKARERRVEAAASVQDREEPVPKVGGHEENCEGDTMKLLPVTVTVTKSKYQSEEWDEPDYVPMHHFESGPPPQHVHA